MKKDLSKYVDFDIPENIKYSDVEAAVRSGYDVFRVGLTETYFGKQVYVEEGSTMDFTLSAELVFEAAEGAKEYTTITMPEKYAKMTGYRPFSNPDNLFFDKALAGAGENIILQEIQRQSLKSQYPRTKLLANTRVKPYALLSPLRITCADISIFTTDTITPSPPLKIGIAR